MRTEFGKESGIMVAVITNRNHPSYPEVRDSIDQIPYETFLRFSGWKGTETRGEKRQWVIDHAIVNRIEWLIFVDDDCVLEPNWWAEMSKRMGYHMVGMLWAPARETREYWGATVLKIVGHPYEKILYDEFMRRGGTHDTVLRVEALKGIEIPRDINYFEDLFIMKHVISNGWQVSVVGTTGAAHYNLERWTADKIRRLVQEERILGLGRPRWYCFESLLFIPATFIRKFLATKDVRVAISFVRLKLLHNFMRLVE